MNLEEVKEITNGLKEADDTPVMIRFTDAMTGAARTVELASVVEEVTLGKGSKRQIVFCAKE